MIINFQDQVQESSPKFVVIRAIRVKHGIHENSK